jgi:hypothetical protein
MLFANHTYHLERSKRYGVTIIQFSGGGADARGFGMLLYPELTG